MSQSLMSIISGGNSMKFFVTGVGGQLGHDVMNELIRRGHEGVGSDIQEQYSGVEDGSEVTKAPYLSLDITDKEAVKCVIESVKPDAVIHCAAWTAVDMAEDDDKIAKVRAINAGGTQNIADVCKKLDCKMTYISTDYVFDGQGTEPWKPDCKDYKPMKISEIPPVVFSEVMRDVDLAVSVAHAGSVDPETSHSTIEMRRALVELTLPLFHFSNVRVKGNFAYIEGKLGKYNIHLGSGVIHKEGGAQIAVLPVHSQSRGRLFLPFVDEDPKTAEILTKIIFFAEDDKIKDPSILNQIK